MSRRPNRVAAVLAVAFTAGAVLLTAATVADDSPRAARWKKVDDAVAKGLPKTAIEELTPIIESAVKDKAFPEAIKAIAKKIFLEGQIQGGKPEERVTRLKAELATAPAEMKPTFEAVIAHWYWHYFQQNRWRFMQRTATAAAPGEDFTTWDLPRLFAEVDKHFTAALADDKSLKGIKVETYDALLEKGTVPDSYRPTLYDFLAFEALSFYTSGEQGLAKPQDAFELDAAGPMLAGVDEFLAWKPETTDAESPKLKAVKLYQALLTYHKDEADKAAFVDADLHRLNYAKNVCFGETKLARYKAAMKALADKYADHPLSALARHGWATAEYEENDFVEARTIALQGANAFPDSPGGKLCHNLVQQIEAKELTILTERVWTDPYPVARVTYRNVGKAYFRVYKTDWASRLRQGNWRPEAIGDADRQVMLREKPVATFSADLPATEDYHARNQDVPLPKDLAPGFYLLFASTKDDFSQTDNVISATDFWVSELAVVMRTRWDGEGAEGFVLTAKGGDPVAGATVKIWDRTQQGGFTLRPEPVQTDANGLFKVTMPTDQRRRQGVLLLVSHKDQSLSVADDVYAYGRPQEPRPYTTTILFTDRSLYRPGQTIQFKGICLDVNHVTDNYKTMAGQPVTVTFFDVNRKEIAKLQTRTNDYGSFSGNFTAPRDRLAGHMTIRVTAGPNGQTGFNVEEYKRPKFQVTVDAPKDPAKLNGEVKVVGKAMAYTGAPINGALVKYRVTREVRFPIWWYDSFWWRIPPNRGTAQEIAHGTATTETDGTFTVTFTAKPDTTVPEKDEPKFHFTVHADVTDTTGETRSGDKSVTVGYTALQANITRDSWLVADKEFKLKIKSSSLDDEGREAKGTLKVYKLVPPEKLTRPDILTRNPPTPRPIRRGGQRVVGIPPGQEPKPDPSDPRSWPLGEVVATKPFETGKDGTVEIPLTLGKGFFRAVVETQDSIGKPVKAQDTLRVLDPAANQLGLKVPHLFDAPKWKLEPGEEFTALWGTGYDRGRAFVEIEHRRKVLQGFWTDAEKTQVQMKQAVTEAMRGGFTVRVTYVRENRAYAENRHVDVPWTNKDLTVKWERFVSKLEPGQKESYTAVVSGPKAVKAAAEVVAGLYDASLDAYLPHAWLHKFNVFRQDHSTLGVNFQNGARWLNQIAGQFKYDHRDGTRTYRHFPNEFTQQFYFRNQMMEMRGGAGGGFGGAPGKSAPATAAPEAFNADGAKMAEGADRAGVLGAAEQKAGSPGPDLSKVSARVNLNETAFFFPQLTAGEDGTVRMQFTMPEALTKWKFQGFAHDKEARSGFLESEVVTAKDLMVQPNPPRFLREGDVLAFTVKVSNQSSRPQTGKVRLTFTDARTTEPIDEKLGNVATDLGFDIPAGESRSFAWTVKVPDGMGPVVYKAVGATDRLSDGEEGMLPVLSKRILVTESLPLPIRGATTKTFDFAKLTASGGSPTLKTQSLTVQMTSQPAWYAVLALPYLMEYPHECSEQVFNRLYANALARHVAKSDPKIRRVFDLWKNTPALDSPLEKNQDLKAVMLDETPWLRQANKESEARRNVGVLFDDNRLNEETANGLKKLAELQLPDGGWSWFPGGRKNDFITLYIVTGFGRMRNLGVTIDQAAAVKAVPQLDDWADKIYREILKHSKNKDDNHLSSIIALYLYGRSFYLKDVPVAKEKQEAVDYWLGQAKKYWLKLPRQNQAHVALGLKRFGDKVTPAAVMKSIKEFSVSNEEMGMFWRDTELSWWWYRAPIETQALMIEAFDEVSNDAAAVEDCKVWLLKQKQTQDWKTTKATADAVYGLLLRGTNLLGSDALVEVKLGTDKVEPEKTEAGTGFYEQKFLRGEVKPEMGKITVTKTDAGVSWGSVHWQYLEDVSKVTPHEGTPLKLEKALFKKVNTKQGPKLEAVAGPVAVGDEVVCRVVLRTDRDMEYVHLKDHRGSGTEPVNVLSRYKFQDGLAYYESTKDTASHFFIEYLPKGVYVFEYPVRVQHKGTYPSGLASVQCMYAPEFNSHSASVMIEAK